MVKLSFALVLIVVGTALAGDLDSNKFFGHDCPVGQTWGCGNNCNRKCINYLEPNPFLEQFRCVALVCTEDVSSCQCDREQGYWYSESLQACVPAEECKANP